MARNSSADRDLAALGLILLEVPSGRREGLRTEIAHMLGRLGLSLDDHPYLLQTRFRNRLPMEHNGARRAGEQRKFYFELSSGSAEEQPAGGEWATGYTSLNELVRFLGRTDTMVRRYLTDVRKRDREGTIYLNHHRSPNGLLRLRELGVPHEGDGLGLFEAVELDPRGKRRGGLPRGAY